MTVSEDHKQERQKLWAAMLAVIFTAVVATFVLTKPAAVPTSMTPLSGLIGLKSMSAQAMPYEQAIANQKPTFIEFYADWCTTCQLMSPTVEKLHQQYGDQINFVMLDIDNPQWATQIKQHKATGVPQFTLLNGSEQPVETWVGKVPKPILSQVLDTVVDKHS